MKVPMTTLGLLVMIVAALPAQPVLPIGYPIINEVDITIVYAEILNPDPFNSMDLSGYTVLMHWDSSVPATQSLTLPGVPGSGTTVLGPLGMLIVRTSNGVALPATMPPATPVFSLPGTLGWIIANSSPPGGAVGLLDPNNVPVDEMTFLNPSTWAPLGLFTGTVPGVAGIQTIRRCQYWFDFNTPADWRVGVTDVTPGSLNLGQAGPTLVVNSQFTFGSSIGITVAGCAPGMPLIMAFSVGPPLGANIGAINPLDLNIAPGAIVPIVDGFGILRVPADFFAHTGSCGEFIIGGAVPSGLTGQQWTIQAAALNPMRPLSIDLTTSATVVWL